MAPAAPPRSAGLSSCSAGGQRPAQRRGALRKGWGGDASSTPSGLPNKSGCAYKPPNPRLPASSQPAESAACVGGRWAAGTGAELRQRQGCPRDACAGCERFGRCCLLPRPSQATACWETGQQTRLSEASSPFLPRARAAANPAPAAARGHVPPRELGSSITGSAFCKAGLMLRDIGTGSHLNNCWGDKTALCTNPT